MGIHIPREVRLVALGALATLAMKATVKAEVAFEKAIIKNDCQNNLLYLYKDITENISLTDADRKIVEEAFKMAVWRNRN